MMSRYRCFDLPPDKIDTIIEYLDMHPDSESKEIRKHLGIKPDSYEHVTLIHTLRHLHKRGFLIREGEEQHYRYSLNEEALNNYNGDKNFKKISNELKEGNITPEALDRKSVV